MATINVEIPVGKYSTTVKYKYVLEVTNDNVRKIYYFLKKKNCSFTINNNTLSGYVTDKNGTKYSVSAGDYIVMNMDVENELSDDITVVKKGNLSSDLTFINDVNVYYNGEE